MPTMPAEAWRHPANGVHEAGFQPNFMNRFVHTNKHGALHGLMF
jgi:hypothetical protein